MTDDPLMKHSVLRLTEESHAKLKVLSAQRRIPMRVAIQEAIDKYIGADHAEGTDVPKRFRPYVAMFQELLASDNGGAIDAVISPLKLAHKSIASKRR